MKHISVSLPITVDFGGKRCHVSSPYQLICNDKKRLKRRILSLRFHEVVPGISSKYFPELFSSEQPIDYYLISFTSQLSARKVLKCFTALRVEPASLDELLQFFWIVANGKRPRPLHYDVIALGSRWIDEKNKLIRIPFVDTKWRLRLTFGLGDYSSRDVFLVRRSSL